MDTTSAQAVSLSPEQFSQVVGILNNIQCYLYVLCFGLLFVLVIYFLYKLLKFFT